MSLSLSGVQVYRSFRQLRLSVPRRAGLHLPGLHNRRHHLKGEVLLLDRRAGSVHLRERPGPGWRAHAGVPTGRHLVEPNPQLCGASGVKLRSVQAEALYRTLDQLQSTD